MGARPRFTLVHALFCASSLLVVAGVTVPAWRSREEARRRPLALAEMREIGEAMRRYHADTGVWPANENLDPSTSRTHRAFSELHGFSCLFLNVHGEDGWNGPYLDVRARERGRPVVATRVDPAEGAIDPWGRRYWVGYSGPAAPAGEQGGMYLISAGRNGELETSTGDLRAGEGGGDDVVHVVSPAGRTGRFD